VGAPYSNSIAFIRLILDSSTCLKFYSSTFCLFFYILCRGVCLKAYKKTCEGDANVDGENAKDFRACWGLCQKKE